MPSGGRIGRRHPYVDWPPDLAGLADLVLTDPALAAAMEDAADGRLPATS
jgi:hypothetical protein